MLRGFVQFTGLFLTIASALFIVKGAALLTPALVEKLSSTMWRANPDIARSLAMQYADARAGAALLVLAAAFQAANGLWPLRNVDFEVSWPGAGLALLFTGACWAAAHRWTRGAASQLHANVETERARTDAEAEARRREQRQ